MEIDCPSKNMYTNYSKSGCPNCIKIKHFLQEKNIEYNIVDCDDYIIENKNIMQRSQNISNDFFDEKYIGGYNETKTKIECFMDSND